MDASLPTVLAVDDDQINLSIMETILEDYDCEVVTALSAIEAMEIVKKKAISLILLDRMLPGMNGIEFTKALRSSQEYKDIPIIMQSAAATDVQIAEGMKAGVNEYLTKPFSEHDLIQCVKRLANLKASNPG